MPDFFGILPDCAVRRELSGGGHVHEAFAAEGVAVAVVTVTAELGVLVGTEVLQDEIMVRRVPLGAVEQRMMQLPQLVVGGHRAVHQGVHRPVQMRVAVVKR